MHSGSAASFDFDTLWHFSISFVYRNIFYNERKIKVCES